MEPTYMDTLMQIEFCRPALEKKLGENFNTEKLFQSLEPNEEHWVWPTTGQEEVESIS